MVSGQAQCASSSSCSRPKAAAKRRKSSSGGRVDLVEAGLAVHQRRQRDEQPAPPAARDHGRGALRVEPDELVVVLDPAAHRLAVGAAVLERVGERRRRPGARAPGPSAPRRTRRRVARRRDARRRRARGSRWRWAPAAWGSAAGAAWPWRSVARRCEGMQPLAADPKLTPAGGEAKEGSDGCDCGREMTETSEGSALRSMREIPRLGPAAGVHPVARGAARRGAPAQRGALVLPVAGPALDLESHRGHARRRRRGGGRRGARPARGPRLHHRRTTGRRSSCCEDFHEPLRDSPEIRRRVRDLYEACLDRGKFVFIGSPVKVIPEEIERDVSYFELALPDQAELVGFLRDQAAAIKAAGGTADDSDADAGPARARAPGPDARRGRACDPAREGDAAGTRSGVASRSCSRRSGSW